MIKDYIEKGIEEASEHFANLEHERWVKWQKYVHSKLYPLGESELSINNHLLIMPTEFYQRWERQIATTYAELSEKEKESDREQVKPYLNWHTSQQKGLIQKVVEMTEEIKETSKYPWQSLKFQDCPNCGQEVNRKWVDETCKEIYLQAISDLKAKLLQEIE